MFKEIIEAFKNKKIMVVGDVMIDEYIYGDSIRISQEAPVPVVQALTAEYKLGGAGNVAANLNKLGADVYLIGVKGGIKNWERNEGINKVFDKIKGSIVLDQNRLTTVKTRIISNNQQVARIDLEDTRPVSEDITKSLIQLISDKIKNIDAVIISDYDKGVITEKLFTHMKRQCQLRGLPLFVDPKIRNFHLYKDVTMIKPNWAEAQAFSGKTDVIDAGEYIFDALGCLSLLITRGHKGMDLFTSIISEHFPAENHGVIDVSGAGDTVTAVYALAKTCGATDWDAADLANIAAGIVVGKAGTATVSGQELLEKVNNL